MDKFVKKWPVDSNARSYSHWSAENEEQTPIDARVALKRVLINSNARPCLTDKNEVVDLSKLPADPGKSGPSSGFGDPGATYKNRTLICSNSRTSIIKLYV
jgi:hypothetical protein